MNITQWIEAIAQNLAAALIIWAFSLFVKRNQSSINKVIGVAIPATKKIFPIVLNAALDIAIFWFFITQLRDLITNQDPITKTDVALISFWMTWLIVYFVKVVLERKRT